MSKHTPGPWKAGPPATGLNPSEHRYIHAGGDLVARASAGYAPNHRLGDQLDANAKLIAAAPDLYAVAKDLRETCAYIDSGISQEMRDRIDAAIAKAEGGAL